MSLDTLRTSKMRSALTVLGVVIGITSIVGMTSLIRGFDNSLRESISQLGPNTIIVQKWGALSFASGKSFLEVARRPNLSKEDAVAIERECPSVALVDVWLGAFGNSQSRIYFGHEKTKQVAILGATENWAAVNFAKLETGHVQLDFANISVNEVLAVLDALTEPQVAAKQITYEHGRCDPSLTVWADREKTHQILINLVSNAVKFTRPSGRIIVDCEVAERDVAFHVADTGEGIPENKLASIFEPFVQVKTGFTREHEGVGLGLAISRDLARMMHGDLTVTSAIGVGPFPSASEIVRCAAS